jgi:endo-1,4-beta-D-glucanase Y
MIKITYTPPSYAKLLHWKLATSIHPKNIYILQSVYESLSLVFPSKETYAINKKRKIKTHAKEKLFSSMMKKDKKKEQEKNI